MLKPRKEVESEGASQALLGKGLVDESAENVQGFYSRSLQFRTLSSKANLPRRIPEQTPGRGHMKSVKCNSFAEARRFRLA